VALAVVADAAPAPKSHNKMRENMKAKMRAKTNSLPMPHKNKAPATATAPKKISAQIGSLMLDLEKKGKAEKGVMQPEAQEYVKQLEKKVAEMSKSVDGLTHQVHELEEAEYARTHEKKTNAPTSSGIGPLNSMTKPVAKTVPKPAAKTVPKPAAKTAPHLEEESESESGESEAEAPEEKSEGESEPEVDEVDEPVETPEQKLDAEEDEETNDDPRQGQSPDDEETNDDPRQENPDKKKDESDKENVKSSKKDTKSTEESKPAAAEEPGYLDSLRSYLPSNPLGGMFGGEEDLDAAASLEESTYGDDNADSGSTFW